MEKKTVRKIGIVLMIITMGLGGSFGTIVILIGSGQIDANSKELSGYFFLISLIPALIALLILKLFGRKRYGKRRAFSPETKERVLRRQNHKCNICGSSPRNFDFDHIGSRTDNSPANCQALCLDCHRDKTRREARNSKNKRKF